MQFTGVVGLLADTVERQTATRHTKMTTKTFMLENWTEIKHLSQQNTFFIP
jgi:hypothetical protein